MYLGDVLLGQTLDFKFTTRQVSGAPHTLAGSPSVAAYVGNGTTEITAGITLTVDFDGRTGLNHVRIVASAGNGYAAGTDVEIVITAGTVNGVSVVGEVVRSFSIQNRALEVNKMTTPTGAIPALGILAAGTMQSGSTSGAVMAASTSFGDDVLNAATVLLHSGTGAGQRRPIDDFTGDTDTIAVSPNWTAPDNTTGYVIFGTPPASTASLPTVLLSPGTGTGQVDITSGVVKSNLVQILGTALTETAGQIAAAFRKFFNVATPTGTVNSIPDVVAGNSGGLPVVGSAMTLTSGERSSIADAVWDEAIVGHLSAGTTGAALNAAGSSGDPWTTPIPGAYGAGTAGNILGNRLDVTLSTRGSQSDLTLVKAKTDLIPAAPAAVGDIPTASTVAAAVWAFVTEGSTTAVQAFRGITAALMGKASGLEGTSAKFRSLADDKDRITATVDESGNRTAVTRDLT